MRIPFVLCSLLVVAVACGGTAVTFPDDGSGASGSGASGAGTGTGASGAGTSSTGGTTGDGGKSGGPNCIEPEGNMLCVRGEANGTGTGETLRAGGPVTFEVYPEGCFSSSCTETVYADCSVVGDGLGELAISAEFCLEDTSASAGGCTDDCGGGGLASCSMDTVAAGTYSAWLGDIELEFTVPSVLPFGGDCIGRLN